MLRVDLQAAEAILAAALAAGLLLRRARSAPGFPTAVRWLQGRWTPLLIGLATSVYYWWVWGGALDALPLVHDEAAYLMQATLFAGGRWSAPAPPLPEFFEQFHVLVTPAFAAKYLPGHAMMLTPGVLLGMPGLVPLLLSGVAGALVFALARRLVHPAVGLLAWALWLGCAANLTWMPSYYSEVTTGALGLGAWWGLLRWREPDGRRGWLLVVAACLGWVAITRPLPALAFAAPIGIVVLRDVARRGAWKELALAVGLGIVILGIVPLWSAGTTGDWRRSPHALYTRMYMPWDRMGFGLDSTPPLRTLPAGMTQVVSEFQKVHAEYGTQTVPAQLARRVRNVAHAAWGLWPAALALLAFAGLLALPRAGKVPLATALLMVALYAGYAHKPGWTLYYLELVPVLAFLPALGLWRVVRAALGQSPGPPEVEASWRPAAFALLCAGALLAVALLEGASGAWRRTPGPGRLGLERALAGLPAGRALVFVRYAPGHDAHDSFVTNQPPLERARVWLAHDLGPHNADLVRLAPDRAPYLYEEATARLLPLR